MWAPEKQTLGCRRRPALLSPLWPHCLLLSGNLLRASLALAGGGGVGGRGGTYKEPAGLRKRRLELSVRGRRKEIQRSWGWQM